MKNIANRGYILHCIALHCIVLYCIVLYCIVLYCIVLYCVIVRAAPSDRLSHLGQSTHTAVSDFFWTILQYLSLSDQLWNMSMHEWMTKVQKVVPKKKLHSWCLTNQPTNGKSLKQVCSFTGWSKSNSWVIDQKLNLSGEYFSSN